MKLEKKLKTKISCNPVIYIKLACVQINRRIKSILAEKPSVKYT